MTINNINFSGDLGLLKYILKKYEKELPYAGSVYNFAEEVGYRRKASLNWNTLGVNVRIWNIVNKDLIIARLMGKIRDEDVMTLQQLKEEYNKTLHK